MKTSSEHKKPSAFDQQSKAFFKGGTFRWEKSEASVWDEMDALIEQKAKAGRVLSLRAKYAVIAVAASILLLIGFGSFMRFYTSTIESSAGEHILAQLPDGSKVELNAESYIKYNPYWWRFNRSVAFEGEALFNVEKGKKFTVVSSKGTTTVLGTSFNIFSRNEVYKVTCLTGSVRVTSTTNNEAILVPNSKAEIRVNGKIEVVNNIETFAEISWKKNIFLFTATPIREVFYEIERQYAIQIDARINTYELYTGNFTKEQNVEEILDYVCPALGLKYKKQSANKYIISEDNE